jgi:GTP-binding protein HflX
MVLQAPSPQGKAVLCMLRTDPHDHEVYRIRLDELRNLVEALNIEVITEIIQTRIKPTAKYCIGKGKVKELLRCVKEEQIDVVVFYNILRSSQKLNLIRTLNCDVLDRYELTLEIFDKMASDSISKLQIEAARLNKLAPYFKLEAKIRFHNEHAFLRSTGEYAFHNQIRELTKRQARIHSQIDELMKKKRRYIQKQRERENPTVCIAGFYNAGKTTLFNALTGDSKLVNSEPFTTLSNKYQRRYIDSTLSLIFIDTIGFVLDLDPRIIQSFRLNLEDVRNADLVLLLLEVTDDLLTLTMKLSEGLKLLKNIGVPKKRVLIVFNKIDVDPSEGREVVKKLAILRTVEWVTISAKERINLNGLLERIQEKLVSLDASSEKGRLNQIAKNK